jgi:hypothetical protein
MTDKKVVSPENYLKPPKGLDALPTDEKRED